MLLIKKENVITLEKCFYNYKFLSLLEYSKQKFIQHLLRTGLPDYEIKNKDLIESSDKQIEVMCKCSESSNLTFEKQLITKTNKILHMKVRKLNEADFTYITKNGDIWKY